MNFKILALFLIIFISTHSSASYVIPNQAVTQPKLAPRSTGTTVGVGGVAISASSGSFSTSSSTNVDVTNLSVTITTTGRPVFLTMQSDTSGQPGSIIANATGATQVNGSYFFLRAASIISTYLLSVSSTGSIPFITIPATSFNYIDTVAAGTYTYKVQTKVGAGGSPQVSVNNCLLVAYEL